jgi:2-C-methyl-D-erythritol 4-phosphate cytidylyltransferase
MKSRSPDPGMTKTPTAPQYFLVIPAAGSGRRLPGACPKQYREILGKPLLQHTLEGIGSLPLFSLVVLALSNEDSFWPAVRDSLAPAIRDRIQVTTGGQERVNSVLAALELLGTQAGDEDWVLVHDAVRPLVSMQDVEFLISSVADLPSGGLLAQRVRDTLKAAGDNALVDSTVDRSKLWQAQTPQMFRYGVLRQALQTAVEQGRTVTDEAAAVEALGLPVRLVKGHPYNIKVTWEEDLELAALLLGAERQ